MQTNAECANVHFRVRMNSRHTDKEDQQKLTNTKTKTIGILPLATVLFINTQNRSTFPSAEAIRALECTTGVTDREPNHCRRAIGVTWQEGGAPHGHTFLPIARTPSDTHRMRSRRTYKKQPKHQKERQSARARMRQKQINFAFPSAAVSCDDEFAAQTPQSLI